MEEANQRWGYTLSRWAGFPHYHVSIFPTSTDDLRAIFAYGSGVGQHQKFNTAEEANKFIAKVRRKLHKHGVKFVRHGKDLARC